MSIERKMITTTREPSNVSTENPTDLERSTIQGRVDYATLVRGIKSSDTEGTIARFSIGRGGSTYPDGRDFGDAILLTDSQGNIGVVGVEGAEARYDIDNHKHTVVDTETGHELDAIPVSFVAVIQTDGSVIGDMPDDLKRALAHIGAEDCASVGFKYFYGRDLIESTRNKISNIPLIEKRDPEAL